MDAQIIYKHSGHTCCQQEKKISLLGDPEFESPDSDSKHSLLGSGYSHKLDSEAVIVAANKKAKVTLIIPPFFKINIKFLFTQGKKNL